MLHPTTTKDIYPLGNETGTGNNGFIPKAAERLDSSVPKESINHRALQLAADVGLVEDIEMIKRGAWLAHDPVNFYQADASGDEKQVRFSMLNKLKLPFLID